jgi:nickel transport protein
MKKRHSISFSFIIIFLTAIVLIGSHGQALAHKVTIFAWVEGDTIFTESKFSGGRMAINAPVEVFDKNGQKLLEGKTDKKGKFSFKIPKATDLRIVLNAAMGHRAEWTISESEIREAGPIVEKKSASEPSGPISVGLSKEEVQRIIEDSLDKKLRPIVRMMTESKNTKPSLTEIIGGIGYIFGLMGVALYFKSRSKKG